MQVEERTMIAIATIVAVFSQKALESLGILNFKFSEQQIADKMFRDVCSYLIQIALSLVVVYLLILAVELVAKNIIL